MSKRTILHTIETAGPGGAETVLLHLASRLNRDRFRSLALLPVGYVLAGPLGEAYGASEVLAVGSAISLAALLWDGQNRALLALGGVAGHAGLFGTLVGVLLICANSVRVCRGEVTHPG